MGIIWTSAILGNRFLHNPTSWKHQLPRFELPIFTFPEESRNRHGNESATLDQRKKLSQGVRSLPRILCWKCLFPPLSFSFFIYLFIISLTKDHSTCYARSTIPTLTFTVYWSEITKRNFHNFFFFFFHSDDIENGTHWGLEISERQLKILAAERSVGRDSRFFSYFQSLIP